MITLATASQGNLKGVFGVGFDVSYLLCKSNRLEDKCFLYAVSVQEAERTWSSGQLSGFTLSSFAAALAAVDLSRLFSIGLG